MGSAFAANKAHPPGHRHWLGLKHYTSYLLSRQIDPDLNLTGLDHATLEDLAWTLSEHDRSRGSWADLTAYIHFAIFEQTAEPVWLEEAIKRNQELLGDRPISCLPGTDNCKASHNLVYLNARRFETTGLVADLDAAIVAAQADVRLIPPSSDDKPNQELDLARLQAYKIKLETQELVEPWEDDDGETSCILMTIVEDTRVSEAMAKINNMPLIQQLREALHGDVGSKSERLQLADALGLALILHTGSNKLRGRSEPNGGGGHGQDIVTSSLEMIRKQYLDCHRRPNPFYLGWLGTELGLSALTPDGPDAGLTETARTVLVEAIEGASDVPESVADLVISNPLTKVLSSRLGDSFAEQIVDMARRSLNFGLSRLHYVGQLGAIMQRRYQVSKQVTDLHEAVRLLEEQWHGLPEKDADTVSSGVLLVKCYLSLLRLTDEDGQGGLVDKAESLADELAAEPMPTAVRWQLGTHRCHCYVLRWALDRDPGALDQAIELGESLRAEMTFDSGDGPSLLGMLIEAYLERSELFLRSTDLQRASDIATLALDVADNLSADAFNTRVEVLVSRARALDELGNCFIARHRFTRDTDFLEEAIRLTRRAVEISRRLGDDDPNKLNHGVRLASLLCQFFRRTGKDEGLTPTIDWCRETLGRLPHGNVDREMVEDGLWECLGERYARDIQRYASDTQRYASDIQRYEADMREAIALARERTAKRHPLLCAQMFARFARMTSDAALFDEAIDWARRAVDEDRQARWRQHQSLAGRGRGVPADWVAAEWWLAEMLVQRLNGRWEYEGRDEDISSAVEYLRTCVHASNRDLITGIRAAILLSDPILVASGKVDMAELASATRRAVGLLPLTIPRALKREDTKDMLKKCAGLAAAAAASALAANPSTAAAGEALELLEASRGILTTHFLDLRAGLPGAEESADALTARVRWRLAQLDRLNAPRDGVDDAGRAGQRTDDRKFTADRAHELNAEIDRLLEQIRSSSSSSSSHDALLRPPTADEMRALQPRDGKGAIVVINASFRCDAILAHDGTIESIPLPHLDLPSADFATRCLRKIRKRVWHPGNEWKRSMLGRHILQWLWGVAVKPILDHLGFTTSPAGREDWPRIWWVPTGRVSQLPFHAAGVHRRGLASSALDRVVSSYSSSIKALMYTQSHARGAQRPIGTRARVVLAWMPETPGLTPNEGALPHVAGEIAAIMSALRGLAEVKVTDLQQPRKRAVLDALASCDVFHFAGHGASFVDDPDRSSLLLDDWKTNPLTAGDMMRLRRRDNNKTAPWLAYLSACSTGANESPALGDEAVHFVTACQLAGFRNVIGSFWEVSDLRSRKLAGAVYARLGRAFAEGGGDVDVDVALALHWAVRQLRGLQAPRARGDHGSLGEEARYAEPQPVSAIDGGGDEVDPDLRAGGGEEVGELLKGLDRFCPVDGGAEQDGDTFRDPDPSGMPRVRRGTGLLDPVLWAPYFHVGA